jgi:hypothetical protein
MRQQTVTFTALPNGMTSDGKLRLSVFIAPRLFTDEEPPVLARFPDFANFGATAAGMSFVVSFGVGHAAVTASFDPNTPAPDGGAVWNAIFPASTVGVEDFTVDTYSDRLLRSYPASNIKQHLSNLYASVGLALPPAFPSAASLGSPNALGQLATFEDNADEPFYNDNTIDLLRQLDRQISVNNVMPAQPYDPANFGLDIIQTLAMHRPPLSPVAPGAALPQMNTPTFDFHKGLGMLGNHPQLLRVLGIVRDLVVPAPPNFTSATTVSVYPLWHPQFAAYEGTGTPPDQSTVAISPMTSYLPGGFIAAPGTGSRLSGRRLRLSDDRYDVVDFDIDGAALKAIKFAVAIARAQSRATHSTPTHYALPALRSEGLVLLESGMAPTLQSDLSRAGTLHGNLSNGVAPTFTADDLVRGYHLDVWDASAKTPQWFPLCARHVTYTPVSATVGPIDVEDEGIVTLAVTSDGQGDPPDIFVPETLAKWSGWSVVAPRPGAHLAPSDSDGLVGQPDNSNATAIKIGIETTVPPDITKNPTNTKLPSLRYGHKYKFRARAADLAGNADAFAAQDNTSETTAATQYSRYDPVNAPVVLLHDAPTAGESVRRMVIRSNYNTSAANEMSIRHIAPPMGSQLLLEHSGVLDDANGHLRGDRDLYFYLLGYDGKSFAASPLNTKVPDPTTPTNGTGATQYIFTDDYVKVPYLTDPISRGVSLLQLPFGTTLVGNVSLEGGNYGVPWGKTTAVIASLPTLLAHRIKLVDGSPTSYAPTKAANANGNVELTLRLPKGSVATIRLSSFLQQDTSSVPSKDIDQLGIWQWLSRGADGTQLSATDAKTMRTLIAGGAHWMATPYEEITLVHAVRQPLEPPNWKVITVNNVKQADWHSHRSAGDTATDLYGNLTVSGRSTSRVQLAASWKENLDIPGTSAPSVASFKARPDALVIDSISYPLADTTSAAKPLPVTNDPVAVPVSTPLTHEFHDHKHRSVDYTMEAISSFAEEFVETKSLGVSYYPNLGVYAVVAVQNSVLIAGYTKIYNDLTGRTFTEAPENFVINEPEDGWITMIAPELAQPGHGLDVTFLQGPISRLSTEAATVPAAIATVNVLASARPDPPHVEYVIPAYAWTGWKTSLSTSKNTRTGNILRVWMERPWYSSGDGEQLAVVCPMGTAQPDAQDAAGLHNKVSLIGQDPIWGTPQFATQGKLTPTAYPSGTTGALLTPAAFPLAVAKVNGVAIPNSQPSNLAVHDVHFDPTRGMWYCDVAINPGTTNPYTPFVRLALARYQANAINTAGVADLRASSVVVAEFAQLSPTRSISVVSSATDVTVTIQGISYRSSGQVGYNTDVEGLAAGYIPASAGPGEMVVHAQTLVKGLDPALYPDTAWINQTEQVLPGTITASGVATWTGKPTLPVRKGSQPMRLVFIEYEHVNSGIGPNKNRGRVVFTATFNV